MIHVENANDFIRVYLCTGGPAAATNPSDPVQAVIYSTTLSADGIYETDTIQDTLNSTASNITCTDSLTAPLDNTPATGQLMQSVALPAGVYRIQLNNGLVFDDAWDVWFDRWDFSVVPNATPTADVDPSVDAGNVFSYNWYLRADGTQKTEALDGQLFIVAPGGYPNTDYVWVLDLNEFAGFGYSIKANSIGLNSPSSGFSAPLLGGDGSDPLNKNSATEKHPIYRT